MEVPDSSPLLIGKPGRIAARGFASKDRDYMQTGRAAQENRQWVLSRAVESAIALAQAEALAQAHWKL